MILLDSDIAVDVFRRFPPAIDWIGSLGREQVALPGFVAMELIQGCLDKNAVRELRVELSDYEIVWPDTNSCGKAMQTYSEAWLSHGLAILDVLIGYTAIYLNLPLHTFNTKHFAAITELKTIQPYKR